MAGALVVGCFGWFVACLGGFLVGAFWVLGFWVFGFVVWWFVRLGLLVGVLVFLGFRMVCVRCVVFRDGVGWCFVCFACWLM